jgi:hypothetical protein
MSERIALTIDATATISRVRWRVASSGPWPTENTLEHPLECIVIQRPPLTDIEIEVTWAARRRRPRGVGQRRAGARAHCAAPLHGSPLLREHWHPGARDAREAPTTLYLLPGCAPSPARAGWHARP